MGWKEQRRKPPRPRVGPGNGGRLRPKVKEANTIHPVTADKHEDKTEC